MAAARNSLQVYNVAGTSPAVIPQLANLADPPAHLMDAAAMDYFLIELVNTIRISSSVAIAREKKIEQEMIENGLLPPPTASSALLKSSQKPRESVGSVSGRGAGEKASTTTDEEEGIRARLEDIGLHIGANFAERLCRDRPLFSETLDVVKFICKDVWSACWDKQVDNLRTNHRGVYVLQDNQFKPISRLSSHEGRAEALRHGKLYVAMSGGIIKGVLARLGFQATVTPEITTLPQCTFQIKLPKGT